MESKKINQLATELTPALSDLTIIGDPTTGISKKITLSQMASLFTGTVEEYPDVASFPLVGVADTIYIALDTNVLYRWDTTLTSYVELSPNIINSLVFSDANGFDGTISLVGSTATLTITTALTTGSVAFIGASGALTQDNANLFWDDTNNRFGIGTNAPTTALDVFGSGIIGRLNGTSTNNSFLGFASAGTNQWSIGNVQSDQRFRIYSEANTAELVSVLQTGEFGIGIANPTTKLHIDGGASALIANLDANVSVAKSISFRSDNSNRFNIEVSGTESGSNAGANFFLRAYSDAGALLNTPLSITRATGAATFISTVTASNGTLIGGSGTANSLPKFNSSNSLTDSLFSENGTNGGFGGANYSGGTGVRSFNITASQFAGIGFWIGSTYTADIFAYQTSGNLLIAADPTNVLTNSNLLFAVDGTTRLTISSTGAATFSSSVTANTGSKISGTIATGAGLFQLQDSGRTASTAQNYLTFADSASTRMAFFGFTGDNNLTIGTDGSRNILLSGGNVGIGTNSPGSKLTVYNTSGATLSLQKSSGAGSIDFGSDTTSYALIESINGGGLAIYTGNGSIAERMRIASDGAVLVGASSTPSSSISGVALQNPRTLGATLFSVGNVTDSRLMVAFINGNGSVGSITTNGTSTAFNTSSDYRLKQDFKNFNGIELIDTIKVYDYEWKTDGTRSYGVIAHELQSIIPQSVFGEKDGEEMQGVDYSKLVPILIKAIQELNAKIK